MRATLALLAILTLGALAAPRTEKGPPLQPGERHLPPGEMCPATLRHVMSVGVGYAGVCSCGGREAHYLTGGPDDGGEMNYAPGHAHKEKRSRYRQIPFSSFAAKGAAQADEAMDDTEDDADEDLDL